jgi:hypothetical protein
VADIAQGDLHLPLEADVVTSARTVTRRLASLSRRRLLLGAGAAAATALSGFEQPVIDDYHLCLHLACDDESRLAAIEAALTRGTPLPSAALRRNQASEDDVTIPGGPFAGGTTMHVSYLRLRLGTWYGQLSQRERVARMYAPQVTPEQVSEFTTDAERP